MIVALIPARGGSKGLPRKNIRPLARHPLIAYSIAAACLASRIDRVVVSTDDEEIAEIGRRYGAEVPFLRPAAMAADHSPDRDFVLHALDWFSAHDRVPDLLVHLRPTTPLRNPHLIDEAIDVLQANEEATSLRSAHEAAESPFKWFTRGADGYFHGLRLADGPDRDFANLPRQAVPRVYVPDGYVDVLRTDIVKQSPTIHGPRILAYVSPSCVEIDTLEDVEVLEYRLSCGGDPLVEFLNTRCADGLTASNKE